MIDCLILNNKGWYIGTCRLPENEFDIYELRSVSLDEIREADENAVIDSNEPKWFEEFEPDNFVGDCNCQHCYANYLDNQKHRLFRLEKINE
jgi:hypothetical protein